MLKLLKRWLSGANDTPEGPDDRRPAMSAEGEGAGAPSPSSVPPTPRGIYDNDRRLILNNSARDLHDASNVKTVGEIRQQLVVLHCLECGDELIRYYGEDAPTMIGTISISEDVTWQLVELGIKTVGECEDGSGEVYGLMDTWREYAAELCDELAQVNPVEALGWRVLLDLPEPEQDLEGMPF